MPSLDFEGKPLPIETGDTIASALYRAGVRVFSRSFKYHRARGLYCLTGDCPNCLVTVGGEPCVRACVTPARDGQSVARENAWPSVDRDLLSVNWYLRRLLPVGFYYKTFVRPAFVWPIVQRPIRRVAGLGRARLDLAPRQWEARNLAVDVLVIGAGSAGLSAAIEAVEAGRSVVLVEEGAIGEKIAPGADRDRVEQLAEVLRNTGATVLERAPAIGIYEGPLVAVAAEDHLHLVHPERVIVATGAVERHGVFPGNDLVGVMTGRGAARLAGVHGLRPGRRAVIVGESAEAAEHARTLEVARVEVVRTVREEQLVSARGRTYVRAVEVRSAKGTETIACDLLVLSLGLVPRDGLLRQGSGLPVVGAGDVIGADESPEPPGRGFVCLCEDVTAGDLDQAWSEGFRSTELLKRYSTATMGPCQGALCHAHLRSFVRARVGDCPPAGPVMARPPARPILVEQAAAGAHYHIGHRTALHQRHLELGATVDWAGAWKRPETYGNALAEYWAARTGVGMMDVGTLGKFFVAGPDAAELLDRVYPCHVRDIREGRLRYALLLNEAGAVIDDGLVCPLGEEGWYLTFTTSGAERAEAWLRDWSEAWGLRVHVVNQTDALGAINLAGPQSRELLARLSDDPLDPESFPFGAHRRIVVAGVPCLAIRLGYVGELGYELHHPSSQSTRLWDALLEAGARPYGLEALRTLRLEKAHFIVGQDSEFDTSPFKLDAAWAVKLEKPQFVGKPALERLSRLPLGEKLVKIVFPSEEAPPEGSPLTMRGKHVGRLTSSRYSPLLGTSIALGWLRRTNGGFPGHVEAAGVAGAVSQTVFYDPEGARLRV